MRTPLPGILIALLLGLSSAAGAAMAASQLTSAPHFLVLGDRERIVLFADGPVAGAMADHRADGSVEVTIPRVALATTLADHEFDDASSGGNGTTRLRLSSAGQGDVRVRIESATPITSVHAFAASKPARVTIDLMYGASAATPTAKTSAAAVANRKSVAAPSTGEKPTVARSDRASGAGATTPAVAAELVGPPREDTSTTAPPTAAVPSAAQPSAVQQAKLGAASPGDPAASSEAASSDAPSTRSEQTLVCRWRRTAGMAYCGPDPKAAVYAADVDTATLAGHLDRGRGGPAATTLAPRGAAEAYLNADLELLQGAKDGWPLPVVASYERALRAYPDFVDAPRARANMALLYHALGFVPELERLSRAKDPLAAPFAGVLLADLRREEEQQQDLTPLLDAGTRAGGVTACLAARVRSNLAADAEQRDAFPEAFATLAKVCPRTLVEDAATGWLRGRAMILAGEAPRAVTTLAALEPELPRRERALLLADLARAYDLAGNPSAAREVEERLASGGLGRRPVRAAQMSLATRDATDGRPAAAERRIHELPLADALESRDRADLVAVTELLRNGNEIAALGMLSERKLDARRLAVADQILLARSLRRVGLLDEAQRLLKGIGASGPAKRLPDAYWEELGAEALARGDANAVLAVVEQWQVQAGTATAGSIALKARARAAKGDARGANETLTKELAALDPQMARDVAVDLAHELRSADPALALGLARGALDAPGLPPLAEQRQAAALRAIADAAEALGDQAAAQDAFARLAREHAGDPAAAGAAYRAARLAASTPVANAGKAAPAASGAPTGDDDPLSRRMAAVGQLYAEVVASMSSGAKP